ncbi:hypothetical protein Pve01_13320 [Planomonospora venezuelensis]|nr:hypothetical protein Pve01_13320 [Planomonospora venezuelensis]
MLPYGQLLSVLSYDRKTCHSHDQRQPPMTGFTPDRARTGSSPPAAEGLERPLLVRTPAAEDAVPFPGTPFPGTPPRSGAVPLHCRSSGVSLHRILTFPAPGRHRSLF